LLLRSLFFSLRRLPPRSTLFPYTTLFRSCQRWCRYGVRPCVRAYLHRTSHSEGFKSGSDGRPGARISPTSVCIREAAESVMRRRGPKRVAGGSARASARRRPDLRRSAAGSTLCESEPARICDASRWPPPCLARDRAPAAQALLEDPTVRKLRAPAVAGERR